MEDHHQAGLVVAVSGAAIHLVLPGLAAVLGSWLRLSALSQIWFTVVAAAAVQFSMLSTAGFDTDTAVGGLTACSARAGVACRVMTVRASRKMSSNWARRPGCRAPSTGPLKVISGTGDSSPQKWMISVRSPRPCWRCAMLKIAS
jgi:hypothetical protein